MSTPEEHPSADNTEAPPTWLGDIDAVHVPGVGWVADHMGENTPFDNRYALMLGESKSHGKVRARLWRDSTGTWSAPRAYWLEEFNYVDEVEEEDAVRFRAALAKEADLQGKA